MHKRSTKYIYVECCVLSHVLNGVSSSSSGNAASFSGVIKLKILAVSKLSQMEDDVEFNLNPDSICLEK